MRFASKSAMASDSSPNWGSKALSGKGASTLTLADSRNEERDEGRRGVVGRETLDREVERFLSCDIVWLVQAGRGNGKVRWWVCVPLMANGSLQSDAFGELDWTRLAAAGLPYFKVVLRINMYFVAR